MKRFLLPPSFTASSPRALPPEQHQEQEGASSPSQQHYHQLLHQFSAPPFPPFLSSSLCPPSSVSYRLSSPTRCLLSSFSFACFFRLLLIITISSSSKVQQWEYRPLLSASEIRLFAADGLSSTLLVAPYPTSASLPSWGRSRCRAAVLIAPCCC